MHHEPWRPGAETAGAGAGPAPTTVDEASMERSKSFVKALQELKNLRPQLYSASEYCEKSYLHSEQKQMVLDNLKDYAVRALVNAVDHLGTVAYKLTDLYEQQASEISTLELKVACLNQQVLTCQTYTDKEGLRQQQMTGAARRHHKHYIVPYAGNKRMQSFSEMQGNADFDSTPRPYSSAKTLQWHLVSEKNSKSNRPDQSESTPGETKTTKPSSSGFRLLGKESSASPLSKHVQSNLTSLDIVSVGMKEIGRPSRPFTLRVWRGGGSPDPGTRGRARRSVSRPLVFGVGRVGASPDPRTQGRANRRLTLKGSGASDPKLEVGRGEVLGAPDSRTKDGSRSDKEEFYPHTGPRVRTAQYPLSGVSVLYIVTPWLGFWYRESEETEERREIDYQILL